MRERERERERATKQKKEAIYTEKDTEDKRRVELLAQRQDQLPHDHQVMGSNLLTTPGTARNKVESSRKQRRDRSKGYSNNKPNNT